MQSAGDRAGRARTDLDRSHPAALFDLGLGQITGCTHRQRTGEAHVDSDLDRCGEVFDMAELPGRNTAGDTQQTRCGEVPGGHGVDPAHDRCRPQNRDMHGGVGRAHLGEGLLNGDEIRYQTVMSAGAQRAVRGHRGRVVDRRPVDLCGGDHDELRDGVGRAGQQQSPHLAHQTVTSRARILGLVTRQVRRGDDVYQGLDATQFSTDQRARQITLQSDHLAPAPYPPTGHSAGDRTARTGHRDRLDAAP